MNAQGVVRRNAFDNPQNASIFHGGSHYVDGIIDLGRDDGFKLNHHHSIAAGTDPWCWIEHAGSIFFFLYNLSAFPRDHTRPDIKFLYSNHTDREASPSLTFLLQEIWRSFCAR